MSCISGAAAVARRFRMSPLRIGEGMEGAESLGVCRVRLPDIGDRRDDFSGYADSIAIAQQAVAVEPVSYDQIVHPPSSAKIKPQPVVAT